MNSRDVSLSDRQIVLLVLSLYALVVALALYVLYPVQTLFIRTPIIFIHEIGHVLAIKLTGGAVHDLHIGIDGNGWTHSTGGNRLLVMPAGYVFSSVVMLAMFWLNIRGKLQSLIPILIGSLYLGVTFTWGSSLSWGNDYLAGYFFGALFYLLGVIPSAVMHYKSYLINSVALFYGISTIIDLVRFAWQGTWLFSRHDFVALALEYFPGVDPLVVVQIFAAVFSLAWILAIADSLFYLKRQYRHQQMLDSLEIEVSLEAA